MTANKEGSQGIENHAPAAGSRSSGHTTRTRYVRAVLLGLLVLSVAGLPAQYTRTPVRNVVGHVTDAGQEPLRGAVVQIEAADTMVIESFITNDRGEYHFRNLRSDADFTLWATFRGNRSKSHAISKFDRKLDHDIPLNIVLEK